MNCKIKLLALLIIFVHTSADYVSYKNYKVYKIIPQTEKEVEILKKLKDENKYMFWSEGIKVDLNVRVMVHPDKQNEFEDYIKAVNIDAKLIIRDVQGLIEDQLKRPQTRTSQQFDWTYYQNLDEIFDWMNKTAEQHPDVVTIIDIGRSVENREIKGIKIDYKKRERPVIGMFEGTLHAREWITPMALTWMTNEFLNSRDENVRFLAENIVWHIFPVTNPDGYVYSFTDNRMWRKNRNRSSFTSCAQWNLSDDLSNGVDLNRNFDWMWMTIGASQNPCDQVYAGTSAFSEPEARAIANHVFSLQREGDLMYYFGMHSYMQMILIPFSHTTVPLSTPNYGDLFEIAIKSAEVMEKRHNIAYQVGTSGDLLYPTSGGGFDWVKGVAEVPIVYLYELRDTGDYGFLLPPEQIIPNSEEFLDSLIEMDRVARQIGYYGERSGSHSIKMSVVLLASVLLFVMLG